MSYATRRMSDGVVMTGPAIFLDMYSDVVDKQQKFESRQKYLPGDRVNIIATYDQLLKLFLEGYKYPLRKAKQKAAAVDGNPYAEVTGSHKFEDNKEVQYDIEHDAVGWVVFPESFLGEKE